jgi:hypothetical protein
MDRKELIDNLLEVKLTSPRHYKIIDETLTRMGIGDNKKRKLYRTCHIIEIDRRFFIVHFKEMFLLNEKAAYFVEGDIKRRNKIADLLEEWGLLKVIDKEKVKTWNGDPVFEGDVKIFIISHRQKDDWDLITMYKPKSEEEEI